MYIRYVRYLDVSQFWIEGNSVVFWFSQIFDQRVALLIISFCNIHSSSKLSNLWIYTVCKKRKRENIVDRKIKIYLIFVWKFQKRKLKISFFIKIKWKKKTYKA